MCMWILALALGGREREREDVLASAPLMVSLLTTRA